MQYHSNAIAMPNGPTFKYRVKSAQYDRLYSTTRVSTIGLYSQRQQSSEAIDRIRQRVHGTTPAEPSSTGRKHLRVLPPSSCVLQLSYIYSSITLHASLSICLCHIARGAMCDIRLAFCITWLRRLGLCAGLANFSNFQLAAKAGEQLEC